MKTESRAGVAQTYSRPCRRLAVGWASDLPALSEPAGTRPTNSSRAYVAPIRITNSIQVHARTFQEGLLPGPLRPEAFLRLSDDVANFASDLPLVVIHSLGQGVPWIDRLQAAHFSVFEPVRGTTSLRDTPALATRLGIKVRKTPRPKSSFTIEEQMQETQSTRTVTRLRRI